MTRRALLLTPVRPLPLRALRLTCPQCGGGMASELADECAWCTVERLPGCDLWEAEPSAVILDFPSGAARSTRA